MINKGIESGAEVPKQTQDVSAALESLLHTSLSRYSEKQEQIMWEIKAFREKVAQDETSENIQALKTELKQHLKELGVSNEDTENIIEVVESSGIQNTLSDIYQDDASIVPTSLRRLWENPQLPHHHIAWGLNGAIDSITTIGKETILLWVDIYKLFTVDWYKLLWWKDDFWK